MNSFRSKAVAEARQQRDLRAASKPIPGSLKKYARLSGLVMIIAPGLGLALFYFLLQSSGYVSVTFTLFFGFFMIIGLIQLISGWHILTAKK